MEEMKKYWAVDRDNVLRIVEEAYDELTNRITTMHSFTSAYGYDLNELGQLARTLQALEIRPEEMKDFNANTRLFYKVFAEHLLKEARVTIEDSVKSSTEMLLRGKVLIENEEESK